MGLEFRVKKVIFEGELMFLPSPDLKADSSFRAMVRRCRVRDDYHRGANQVSWTQYHEADKAAIGFRVTSILEE